MARYGQDFEIEQPRGGYDRDFDSYTGERIGGRQTGGGRYGADYGGYGMGSGGGTRQGGSGGPSYGGGGYGRGPQGGYDRDYQGTGSFGGQGGYGYGGRGGGYGRGGVGGGYDRDFGGYATPTGRDTSFGGSGGGYPQGGIGGRQLRAADLMTQNPETVSPQDSLQDAARKMRDLNIGVLPVVDSRENRRLQGIITDRDIAVRAVADGQAKGRVEQYMTRNVETVNQNDPVDRVLQVMERAKVRRVPIVDREQRLVGIIAQADVATDYTEDNPQNERRFADMVERISEPGGPHGEPDRGTQGAGAAGGGSAGGTTRRRARGSGAGAAGGGRSGARSGAGTGGRTGTRGGARAKRASTGTGTGDMAAGMSARDLADMTTSNQAGVGTAIGSTGGTGASGSDATTSPTGGEGRGTTGSAGNAGAGTDGA